MPFPPDLLTLTAAALLGAAVTGESPIQEKVGEAAPAAELLGREQLVELAGRLAAEHAVFPERRPGQPLIRSVKHSARVIYQAYRNTAAAARRHEAITPAAEWLLDNFHIVEDQI